jgi:hypothetical protein
VNTNPVTVTNCTNPDVNVTFVNVPVPGNVNTNDMVTPPPATAYGIPTLIDKPSGSTPSITMNLDGTYTFVADVVGVYKYVVPVCVPPVTVGCPTSDLWITVVDHIDPNKKPVANVDFGTMFVNTGSPVKTIVLNTLANDRCVVVTGCTLDPATITIIKNPSHGAVTVALATGNTTYTPVVGFTGKDTLIYQVCVTGSSTNCAQAKQIITVVNSTALNTTVADDDFATTQEEVAVSGNVKDNDSDPEGDVQTVTAQSVTVAGKGTLVLATTGAYTFTPVKDFFGPIEFPYTTCDNHITNDTCAMATLHILVLPDLTIKVRVYLEGALMNNSDAVALDGRPLMRDNLRSAVFTSSGAGVTTGQRIIPAKDPYKFAPKFYGPNGRNLPIASQWTKVPPPGAIATKYDAVTDSANVFSINGTDVAAKTQNAIVDWVFIELRSKGSNTTILATRSALLQRDGDVVELDGYNGLKFPGVAVDSYYVVVRHRNHLGAMSKFAQTPKQLTTLVNFTKTSELPVFDFASARYPTASPVPNYTNFSQNTDGATTTPVKPGYRALWAGSMNFKTKEVGASSESPDRNLVKFDAPNDDLNDMLDDVRTFPSNSAGTTNFDFALGYMAGDYNLDGKVKFDNPNDDKNLLYAQILYFGLNTRGVSNYDYMVEQIP